MKLKVEIDFGNRTMDKTLERSIHRVLKSISYNVRYGVKHGNVTNDTGDRIGRFTLVEGVDRF